MRDAALGAVTGELPPVLRRPRAVAAHEGLPVRRAGAAAVGPIGAEPCRYPLVEVSLALARKCRCPRRTEPPRCRSGSLADDAVAPSAGSVIPLETDVFCRAPRSVLGVVGVGALEVDGTPTDRGGQEKG